MSFVHALEENVDDCDDDFPRPCDDHFFFVLDNNGDFPTLQDDHFVPKLSAEKVKIAFIYDALRANLK